MSTSNERRSRLAGLSADKKALLEKWSQGTGKSLTTQVIPRRSENGPAPVSFVQEWYLRHPLNEPAAMLLEGVLDGDLLLRSINEIVRRHEMLRTTFHILDGKPVQVIAPPFTISLPSIESLEALPVSERLAHGLQLGMEDTQNLTFNLERGPTWRIRLLRLAPDQHLCLALFSSAIIDGRSQINFFLELAQIYDAFADGLPSPLPDLPLQFADFAAWQRQRLQGTAWDTYVAYWRPLLADTPKLHVPTDIPRSSSTPYRRDLLRLEFPMDQAESIRALSRSEQCTMFVCLFALFQILIYHFTGQQDLFIGVEVTSRQLRETMDLIGAFTHTLPMRMLITESQRFGELLQRGQQMALDVYAHHDMATEELVEICDPGRDLLHTPLFHVKAAYFTDVIRPSSEKPSRLVLHPQTLNGIEQPPEDLKIQFFDFQRGLALHLEYNANLFQASTIAKFVAAYHKLLLSVIAKPDQTISELLQQL